MCIGLYGCGCWHGSLLPLRTSTRVAALRLRLRHSTAGRGCQSSTDSRAWTSCMMSTCSPCVDPARSHRVRAPMSSVESQHPAPPPTIHTDTHARGTTHSEVSIQWTQATHLLLHLMHHVLDASLDRGLVATKHASKTELLIPHMPVHTIPKTNRKSNHGRQTHDKQTHAQQQMMTMQLTFQLRTSE